MGARVQTDSQRYLKLIRPAEIYSNIESCLATYSPKVQSLRVDRAHGLVSAEDVTSSVDIPARTASAMDGYVVKWSDLMSASPSHPRIFSVGGSIYPDSTEPHFLRSGETYYIATGARLPNGGDTVVRIEESTPFKNNSIMVRHTIPKGKNVANKGEDVRAGQVVVGKGRVLDPTDIALLIGVGKTRIKVYRVPRVGLISVGDELEEFTTMLRNRNRQGVNKISNNYLTLISGFVRQLGSKAVSLGTCRDNPVEIRRAVLSGSDKCDVIFTIGGSSVGRHDNVLSALEAIQGSRTLFHGARVVPIRPSGVVMLGDKPVVIMPGHAVSALLTYFVIALPILNIMSGLTPLSRRAKLYAVAKDAIVNERAIDALSLVKLEVAENDSSAASYKASPLRWGSNLLSNLSEADGFVWLLPHQTIPRNHRVTVQLFAGSPLAKSKWSFPRD